MTATLETAQTPETETPPTVSIPAVELVNILSNASIFASTDKTVEILNAVRLTVRGTYLVGTATDRYQLAEIRGKLAEDANVRAAEFEATIPTASIKLLLPLLKAVSSLHKSLSVQLTADNDANTLHYVTPTGVGTVPLQYGDWPSVARLISERVDMLKGAHDGPLMLAFNPKHLANLGKLKDHRATASKRPEPVKLITNDAAKPVAWAMEDYARGMLMPVCVKDATPLGILNEWADA